MLRVGLCCRKSVGEGNVRWLGLSRVAAQEKHARKDWCAFGVHDFRVQAEFSVLLRVAAAPSWAASYATSRHDLEDAADVYTRASFSRDCASSKWFRFCSRRGRTSRVGSVPHYLFFCFVVVVLRAEFPLLASGQAERATTVSSRQRAEQARARFVGRKRQRDGGMQRGSSSNGSRVWGSEGLATRVFLRFATGLSSVCWMCLGVP